MAHRAFGVVQVMDKLPDVAVGRSEDVVVPRVVEGYAVASQQLRVRLNVPGKPARGQHEHTTARHKFFVVGMQHFLSENFDSRRENRCTPGAQDQDVGGLEEDEQFTQLVHDDVEVCESLVRHKLSIFPGAAPEVMQASPEEMV